MLVTYPRLGHSLRIATPPQPAYQAPGPVWDRVKELKCDEKIWWGTDPREAVQGADVVVTDTWYSNLIVIHIVSDSTGLSPCNRISMGQEAEYEQRVRDFAGYQVTEALCREGGANPSWKFLHCLPRKKHEVDDEVRTFPSLPAPHSISLMPSLTRFFTAHVHLCSQKLTTASGQSWPPLSVSLPPIFSRHMLTTPPSLLFGKWDITSERGSKKREVS